MERKQRVVVYGNTVALAGIAASIKLDPGCEVVAHAGPMGRQELRRLTPDVVVFELGAVGPEFPYTMTKERPGLLLIGIDPETNRALLWYGQQAEGWTSQDLAQVIHQAKLQVRVTRTKERTHTKEKKTMATEKEMYELLGRAMVDADFRAALTADPTGAAAGLGISLTDEQQAGLKASDLATAEGLDERLSKWYRAPGL